LAFALLFLLALFVAFASAPVTSVTYIPVYSMLWIAFLAPFRSQRRAVLWRLGTIAGALLILGLIGVPFYLTATAMTSARFDAMPPMFHPGQLLLSPAYWLNLVDNFPLCSPHMQLMCWSSVVGVFEIAVLIGAACLVFACSGIKGRYGLVIISLLALLHFYALLSMQIILGALHTISTPYLMWAFFPLAAPAAIAAVTFAPGVITGRRAENSRWALGAGWIIAIGAAVAWVELILPSLPRLSARTARGLPPIAHVPVNRGPIVNYLEHQVGLKPGGEFRGYASTYLGAPDGLIRKLSATSNDAMTWDAYIAARAILFERFGNSFLMMDLWNSRIPTFEEYGQWTSKQMYAIDRDLLSERQDQLDLLMSSILLYRFRPLFLRALGVRFVIADGTLADPAIDHVMSESDKAGATINLYEIKGANLGQFSPTQVTWASDYPTAVRALRESADLEHRVVLLGTPERRPELVPAAASRLVALRDGYQLTASASGVAMLVLPVQFSHCWRIDPGPDTEAPQLVRANVVQTGILFKDKVDARLRFGFEPWRTFCRFRDGEDLSQFGIK
jgi:hypothetical protein